MIKVIVGTETGTAEYVADEILELFEQNDLTAETTLTPEPNELLQSNTWLICTSTQGAGDVPQNLMPFYQWLTQTKPDLKEIKFAVIALGDSSYDTYCQAGKQLYSLLESCHAQPLFPTIEIDAMDENMPEDIATEQLIDKITIFK